MTPKGWIEIGAVEHPRDGASGTLCRTPAGIYVLWTGRSSRNVDQAWAAKMTRELQGPPEMVGVRLSAAARDGLRREGGRRQAEDGSEWTLSRVVEALLAERAAR